MYYKKKILLIVILVISSLSFSTNFGETTYAVSDSDTDLRAKWSSNTKLNNTFTLALLFDGSNYYIVAGDGERIVVFNSSGSIVYEWDLSSAISSVSPELMGFGYLGSNLSHVYSSVAYFYRDISIGFSRNYHLGSNIIYITPKGVSLSEEKTVSRYSFSTNRELVDVKQMRDPEFRKNLMPPMKEVFGNMTTHTYPLLFEVNKVNMFLLDDSATSFIDFDYSAESIAYISGDVLPNLGRELIVASNGSIGVVTVYTLIGNSTWIGNDAENNIYLYPIDFGGSSLDIVAFDFDSDGLDEVFVENNSEIWVWGYNSGNVTLEKKIATGPVDLLATGRFIYSSGELAFYDPTEDLVEIWNMSGRVYDLKLNGTPINDMVISDFDGDGFDDIALVTGSKVHFIYGKGQYSSYASGVDITSNILLADVDGDSILELVYASGSEVYLVDTAFSGVGNTQYLNSVGVRNSYLFGDSDLDGFADWEELYVYGTSPYDPLSYPKRTRGGLGGFGSVIVIAGVPSIPIVPRFEGSTKNIRRC